MKTIIEKILDELQDINMRLGDLEQEEFNTDWNGCQKRLTAIYEELVKEGDEQ